MNIHAYYHLVNATFYDDIAKRARGDASALIQRRDYHMNLSKGVAPDVWESAVDEGHRRAATRDVEGVRGEMACAREWAQGRGLPFDAYMQEAS